MTRLRFGVLVTMSLALAAGCAKKSAPAVTAPAPSGMTSAAAAAPPVATRPSPGPAPELSEDEIFARKTLAELNAERPLGDAFFDYDQSTLRDDARAALARNAEWLKRWRQVEVLIEGHSDERGTAEYNLALAARRAEAVRTYLLALGIPETRLVSTSLGREQPFCRESSEGCWQQNRRGHFVITAK
ncbi:MAG: OmpA family protein [Vicinamibacterales bacterium]